jgi:hypothetical protein
VCVRAYVCVFGISAMLNISRDFYFIFFFFLKKINLHVF